MKLNSKMKVGFDFNLESIGYEDSIEFEIVDLKTDIVIANILAVNTYESIIKFIQKNKNNSKESKLLLSKIILESNGSIAYSTKKLPRIKYPESNNEITVIIPVYSGILETIECLESVFLAKNITPNQVVIINDCTPDPLIQNYLDKIEQKNNPSVIIINKNKNGGFSESVNMGMIVAGSQDVILLNSDTVVQDEWIDRIIAIAKMDTKIGTITPMSNNAEICTVPYMCKSLPINCSELAKSVDIVAKNVNSGKIIDIPVAVGFCMYIRRECIEEIGLFDAATWGRGYGEEVDFCLKASSKGWRHVMACDTFIVHRGGISFGDEKLERIKESSIKITERYPFYNKVIQRFITNDPVQINRRNINVELINKSLPSKRILHITHTFGGGTQQYINDIMILNTEDGYTPLILAFRENGECELIFDLKDTVLLGFYINEHVEKFIANEFDCLKETLLNLNIDKIHIHAPFGIEFNLLNWFKETYLYDITIHDYAWICPRVTLTVDAGKYCGEPSVDKCNQCVKFYKPHIGLKNILNFVNGNVMQYRENFKSLIKKADTIFVGTNDVKIRMEKHGMIGNYHVTPHPVTINSIFSKSINLSNTSIDDGIIKVALFGAISDIKGFYVLVECAENALKKKLPIHFIVFGHTMNDELCRSYTNIEIIGKYLDDDLERMVKQYRPHVSFFPSQWPETFSYTLSHSLRFGIYPIVSDIGAQSERVKNIEFGYVFDGSLPASTICEMLIKQALNILDI
jgi:GT2 family glycosyltransferase/glycosyltransferase involved in cell wall biosynthesis